MKIGPVRDAAANMNDFKLVCLLALAAASVTLTISRSSLFREARLWVLGQSKWLGLLFKCPYCMGHWVSFGLMLVYHPKLFDSGCLPIDYLATAFALITLNTIICDVIMYLMPFAPDEGRVEDEIEALHQALFDAKIALQNKDKEITDLKEQLKT